MKYTDLKELKVGLKEFTISLDLWTDNGTRLLYYMVCLRHNERNPKYISRHRCRRFSIIEKKYLKKNFLRFKNKIAIKYIISPVLSEFWNVCNGYTKEISLSEINISVILWVCKFMSLVFK